MIHSAGKIIRGSHYRSHRFDALDGADIGDWHVYASDNAKLNYFKEHGFNYFCNVDGAKYFVQIQSNYVRTGRRNVDGYRMYDAIVHPEREWFTDLFDVNEVFDSARPTPVPGVL